MRKRAILLITLSFVTIVTLYSENFKFTYKIDDKYRILSRVDESVYINRHFSHKADILNRITVHVKDVKNDGGLIDATYQTSERASGDTGKSYECTTEYESEFIRDSLGVYNIAPRYFMPVVRDVPVFSGRDVQPGDTWSYKGEEVHDFRKSFGIPDAYHIPIYVNYTYLGKAEYEGKTYDLLSVRYDIYYRASGVQSSGELYPAKISGRSAQHVYWNAEAGRPEAYEENFDFKFEMSSGDTVQYTGIANAYVIESKIMDKTSVADNINDSINKGGIKDTGVSVSDEGVKITLSNIQFKPESFELTNTESKKLDQIAEILSQYPDRDILVKGHTALAGTEEGRMKLSSERAASVADYLLSKGIRRSEQIIVKGVGAKEPVADNSTAEGKKANRRVEIIILEN
ncbi:MAG: OmpA family protein [Spirochaetales bacterium]|nr:OmpA family protein [Spirochaetales bacterium]